MTEEQKTLNSDLAKDRYFNYSILNYLRAAYQGKLSALNVLSQLSEPTLDLSNIDSTQRTLEKINGWVQQVYTDQCLFSAMKPSADTFEAQNVLDLLEALLPDLYQNGAEVVRILTLPSLPSEADLRYLISSIFRHTYARDTYIRGFAEFTKRLGTHEQVKSYDKLINQSSDTIKAGEAIFNTYRTYGPVVSNFETDYLLRVHVMSRELPIVFQTHLHDIRQLLAPFKGGPSFQVLAFTEEEARAWEAVGCGPVPAGYWRAHGFQPEEAQQWVMSQFTDPAMAFEWRLVGFAPAEARPWAVAGFPPAYAMGWFAAGFDPQKAKESIDRGVKDPPPPLEKKPEEPVKKGEDEW